MKNVILLGSYDFAEEVADLISDCPDLQLAAFCENLDRTRTDRTLLGKPILWVEDLPKYRNTHEALCAIGTTKRSAYVDQVEAMDISFCTLIHPTSRVSAQSEIGRGSIVSAGVILAANTQIGEHVILNRGALIGHHTRIGRGVTVSPGANIAGRITIMDNTYIGMGSIVLNDLQVGQGAVISAGSVVTKDVPARTKVAGVPARIIERDIDSL